MRFFLYSFFSLLFFSGPAFGNQHETSHKLVQYDQFASYVDSYVELYKMSPGCFFPYSHIEGKTNGGVRSLLKKSVCSHSMKNFCKENSDLLDVVLSHKLKQISSKEMKRSHCRVSLELKDVFLRFRKTLVKKQEEFLKSAVNYLEAVPSEKDNREVLLGLKGVYDKTLQQQGFLSHSLAKDLLKRRHKILLSKSMTRLARGDFYDLEDVDLIQAFHFERKKLKKEFLKYTKKESSSAYVFFGLNKIRKKSDITEKVRLFEDYHLSSRGNLKLLREAFTPNANFFHLMMRGKTQRALWLLRNLGENEKAQVLEQKLLSRTFADKNKVAVKGLNLGISSSYRVHFRSGHSAVYKPEDKFLIASNSKGEVAAYLIDRMLNLNMVPLTFIAHYKDGKMGSSQYFVENAHGARVMREYNGLKPRKFDRPSGRIVKSREMLLFDWLIGNMDRNVDNYMLLDSGKMVLIDHGMSFLGWYAPKRVSRHFVMKRLPSRELFKEMEKIVFNQEAAKKELKPYLPKKKVKAFLAKVRVFVAKVKKLQKKGQVILPSKPSAERSPV